MRNEMFIIFYILRLTATLSYCGVRDHIGYLISVLWLHHIICMSSYIHYVASYWIV